MNERLIRSLRAIITAMGGVVPSASGKHWNQYTLDLVDAAITAAGGTPRSRTGPWNEDLCAGLEKLSTSISPAQTTFTRLTLANKIATADPGTRLSTPIVDGGDGVGISFPLTGGWSSTDWPGAWPYVIWELPGVDGVALGGEDQFDVEIIVKVRTHPGDTTDSELRVMIVNELDITSGTVDGQSVGIRWTGGSRAALAAPVTNGTIAAGAVGTGVAGAEYLQASITRQGAGAASVLIAPRAAFLDSAKALIASSNANLTPGNGVVVGNPSKFYIALACGRTNTTAGVATIAADLYVTKPAHLALPS